jgi:hypothetical protein
VVATRRPGFLFPIRGFHVSSILLVPRRVRLDVARGLRWLDSVDAAIVATCPEIAGTWTATPDPADVMTCRDPAPVEIAQTGCAITLTLDTMSSAGLVTTDSATLSASGAFAATLTLPGDGGGVPGYVEGSASGSAGSFELGATSPPSRICGFTLSR